MHLLILLLISLYFSDPSGSNRFFLSSLLFCTDQKIAALTQGYFFSSDDVCHISPAVSITAVLKVVIIESRSVSSLSMMVRGANFPPVIVGRFPTHWDLSAFWGQTWVLCVLACWFFSDEGGSSSSASRGHFQCLLLENFVFWHCLVLIGSASSRM